MPHVRHRCALVTLVILGACLVFGATTSSAAPPDFTSGSLNGVAMGGGPPSNTTILTVPMGKYFVLTDLEYALTWTNSATGNRVEGAVGLYEGMAERWSTIVSGFTNIPTDATAARVEGRDMLRKSFTTGIAYAPFAGVSFIHGPWSTAAMGTAVTWRLSWSGYFVSSTLTGVVEPTDPGERLQLGTIAPNPLDDETRIGFNLGKGSKITLRVVDVNGRIVRRLYEGRQPAGEHMVTWDARDDRGQSVGAGVYFIEMLAGKDQQVRRAVVIN